MRRRLSQRSSRRCAGGEVQRHEGEAEREHPEAENRQKAEQATHHQQDADDRAHPPRHPVPSPFQGVDRDAGDLRAQFRLRAQGSWPNARPSAASARRMAMRVPPSLRSQPAARGSQIGLIYSMTRCQGHQPAYCTKPLAQSRKAGSAIGNVATHAQTIIGPSSGASWAWGCARRERSGSIEVKR